MGERVSDDRLAELAADRTGFDLCSGPNRISLVEELSIIDELRAWRKYKLTDEEKGTLRDWLRGPAQRDPEVDSVMVAVVERLTSNGARHG